MHNLVSWYGKGEEEQEKEGKLFGLKSLYYVAEFQNRKRNTIALFIFYITETYAAFSRWYVVYDRHSLNNEPTLLNLLQFYDSST